jgi:predicted RNA binding protein YcfA (HicA-like mRNA interferase family)
MKIPRDLSGAELVRVLCRKWDYKEVHQVGSHIVLETNTPSHQRMAVPNHPSLRIGTLNAILRSVAEHKMVTKEKILESL